MEKINIKSQPLVRLLFSTIPSLALGIFIPINYIFFVILLLFLVGIISLILKKKTFAYFCFCSIIGFTLSLNYNKISKIRYSSYRSTALPVKIYGCVEEVYPSKSNAKKVKINGIINNDKINNFKTSILLTIFDKENKLQNLDIGDKISCVASIRFPMNSNLSTDPAEIQMALAEEFTFFGFTNSTKIIKTWKSTTNNKGIIKEIRDLLKARLQQLFNTQYYPYYSALLLGDKSNLDIEQKEKFATTGMSHILALSGFHIGILSLIIFYILSFLKNKWLKFFLASSLLLCFLAIVNFPPSGVRAYIMITAFLYTFTLERKISPLNVMAFVLIVIMLFSPLSIFSVGFQLSYLAVLGIVLFYKKIHRLFQQLVKTKNKIILSIISILATTISAQIFTAPVVAYYFGYYTFLTYFSNLLLLPLFSATITLGFIALFCSIVAIELGKIFSTTSDFVLSIALHINDWIAKNFDNLSFKTNGIIVLSIFVSLLTIWLFNSKSNREVLAKFAFSLLYLLLLIFVMNSSSEQIMIFPRKNYVAVILPSNKTNLCLLLDRKPHIYPTDDIPMVKFINSLKGDIVIGVTGNAGIAVSDKIRYSRQVKVIEIPSDIQKKISLALFGDLSIFKK